MAIETRWYREPQVFYLRLYGKVSGENMRQAVLESQKAVNAYPGQKLHTITDVSDMTQMPHTLAEVAESVKQLKDNTIDGWAVMVGHQNALVKLIGTFLAQLFGFRYRSFETLEEGLAFLNEMDDALPSLLPVDSEFATWLAARREQAREVME